jgi:hypothetical protein
MPNSSIDSSTANSDDASFDEVQKTTAEIGPAVLEGIWCIALHSQDGASDKLTPSEHALISRAVEPFIDLLTEDSKSEKLATLRADALKAVQAALPASTVEEISGLTPAAQEQASNHDDSSGTKSDAVSSSVCTASSWRREIDQLPAKTVDDLALVLAYHASNAVSIYNFL